MDLERIREDFTQGQLGDNQVADSPIDQFQAWFAEYELTRPKDLNAMVVSTVDTEGKPQARILLLKELAEDGFVFYTNYESNKGVEIENNPNVQLLFYWSVLERQVRVSGTVMKVTKQRSQEYFKTRPYESQIGALASDQSRPISGRDKLEGKFKKHASAFPESEGVPMPEYWGGYVLDPTYFEFWQGRASRLHDRITYTKEDGQWKVERIQP